MKAFVMFSFLLSILGCPGDNTTDLRFESGRAILWPQWKKSYDSDIRPHNFLIGLPGSPAFNFEGLSIVFADGNTLRVSSDTTPEDIRKSFGRMGQYDVGGKLGPAIHPGKSYFEWPAKTTAVNRHGVMTAFFAEGRILGLFLNNESDAIDKLTFNEQEFDYPLKLDDLEEILGNPKGTLRYFSQ